MLLTVHSLKFETVQILHSHDKTYRRDGWIGRDGWRLEWDGWNWREREGGRDRVMKGGKRLSLKEM
jgi:hypothetical protein